MPENTGSPSGHRGSTQTNRASIRELSVKNLPFSWRFQKKYLSLQTEREGLARQKKRNAPNLRDENVGNFRIKAN